MTRMTDDYVWQRVEQRSKDAAEAGEPRTVTLSKEEITDYAHRWLEYGPDCEPDLYIELGVELCELGVGDIMAVLKRAPEVAKETAEAMQRILKMDIH